MSTTLFYNITPQNQFFTATTWPEKLFFKPSQSKSSKPSSTQQHNNFSNRLVCSCSFFEIINLVQACTASAGTGQGFHPHHLPKWNLSLRVLNQMEKTSKNYNYLQQVGFIRNIIMMNKKHKRQERKKEKLKKRENGVFLKRVFSAVKVFSATHHRSKNNFSKKASPNMCGNPILLAIRYNRTSDCWGPSGLEAYREKVIELTAVT